MNNPSQLSIEEFFWLGGLVLLIVGCIYWASKSRDPRAWMQPPLVMAVILVYYGVAGPLKILSHGEWFDRTVNLRSGMAMSWAGAAAFFLAFLAGYAGFRQRLKPPIFSAVLSALPAWRWGTRLNIIVLILFCLAKGSRLIAYLNPLGVADATVTFTGVDLGAFANYFELSVNLLIPGCLLLAAAWIRRKDSPLPLILWLLATTAIFTSLGFRWRLAVLIGSFAILWFLARRVRPKFVVILPTILGLLLMAGFVGMTREYGNGLHVENAQGKSVGDIILASFGESSIFLTSGALMERVPDQIPYVGLTPIVNALLHPIPRALLPAKDSAGYLLNATAVVYGDPEISTGSAITNYAEYYLMGGWFAVICGGVFLGYICRRLWLWFRLRGDDPFAQVAYVCNVAYLYVVVSRGYIPQVLMMWFFTAAPLFLIYFMYRRNQFKSYKSAALMMRPRSTHHLLPAHLRHQRL